MPIRPDTRIANTGRHPDYVQTGHIGRQTVSKITQEAKELAELARTGPPETPPAAREYAGIQDAVNMLGLSATDAKFAREQLKGVIEDVKDMLSVAKALRERGLPRPAIPELLRAAVSIKYHRGETINKAKVSPEGTRSIHGGKKVVKQGGKWIPVGAGAHQAAQATDPKAKGTTGRGVSTKARVEGRAAAKASTKARQTPSKPKRGSDSGGSPPKPKGKGAAAAGGKGGKKVPPAEDERGHPHERFQGIADKAKAAGKTIHLAGKDGTRRPATAEDIEKFGHTHEHLDGLEQKLQDHVKEEIANGGEEAPAQAAAPAESPPQAADGEPTATQEGEAPPIPDEEGPHTEHRVKHALHDLDTKLDSITERLDSPHQKAQHKELKQDLEQLRKKPTPAGLDWANTRVLSFLALVTGVALGAATGDVGGALAGGVGGKATKVSAAQPSLVMEGVKQAAESVTGVKKPKKEEKKEDKAEKAMLLLDPDGKMVLVKAKYISRKKGPDGKWQYKYAKPKKKKGKKEKTITVTRLAETLSKYDVVDGKTIMSIRYHDTHTWVQFGLPDFDEMTYPLAAKVKRTYPAWKHAERLAAEDFYNKSLGTTVADPTSAVPEPRLVIPVGFHGRGSGMDKASPPGGGWSRIPGGHKGGFRRKKGGKFEYWYPGGRVSVDYRTVASERAKHREPPPSPGERLKAKLAEAKRRLYPVSVAVERVFGGTVHTIKEFPKAAVAVGKLLDGIPLSFHEKEALVSVATMTGAFLLAAGTYGVASGGAAFGSKFITHIAMAAISAHVNTAYTGAGAVSFAAKVVETALKAEGRTATDAEMKALVTGIVTELGKQLDKPWTPKQVARIEKGTVKKAVSLRAPHPKNNWGHRDELKPGMVLQPRERHLTHGPVLIRDEGRFEMGGAIFKGGHALLSAIHGEKNHRTTVRRYFRLGGERHKIATVDVLDPLRALVKADGILVRRRGVDYVLTGDLAKAGVPEYMIPEASPQRAVIDGAAAVDLTRYLAKARSDAPGYRPGTTTELCLNCDHFTNGTCTLFAFKADSTYTCDDWEG